jgi:hypothetical protein
MCVIMIASKTRPTEEMVERAWNSNKDGAGIAWEEKDKKGEWDVVYEKGIMQVDRIKELCQKLPLPYVVHFRVASVGGVKPELTHPFPITAEVRLDLRGRTKGGVLFHNGHWGPWNEKALDAAIHSNNVIPSGSHWSDSRAMAWMTHIYGPGFMELLTSQKGVIMTPSDFDVFTGNGWDKINDVWCSNDYFWGGRRWTGNHQNHNTNHQHNTGYNKMCSVGKCTRPRQEGKTICKECESEATGAKEGDSLRSSVGQSQPSSVAVVNGGTSPFGEAFTLAQVEAFAKQGICSKSQLKKYRKANGNRLEKGNRGLRARKQLQELTSTISEQWILKGGSKN